jgi:hypothetical protein
MKIIIRAVFFVFISGLIGCSFADSSEEALTYYGMSDASAAAAVGREMFVVADDENNVLRVYKTGKPSLPVFSCDLTAFLGTEPEHPEVDIEGATVLDDTIYWITSHGRNKDGKMRPNRYRFFATKVEVENQSVTIQPVGIPCRTLVDSLLKAENMSGLGLDQATRLDAGHLADLQRRNLAPKENGLNIEALCASADGNTVYIGFRNPLYLSKAIVISLNNPEQVIESQQPPIFADPLLWDLKGYGIRSMEYSRFHKVFFIIAGPHNDEPAEFALYRWSGDSDEQPMFVQSIDSDFSPETLVVFENSPDLLLLSDDGSLPIDVPDASECMEGQLRKDGKCLNKHLTDPNKKSFRAIFLRP